MWQRYITILSLLCLSITLSGCLFRAFHPTIRQGNIISDASLNAIKPGTPVTEVVELLGEPILKNIYPNGQLAYVYTLQIRGGTIHKRFLVLYFHNGRVTHKETDGHWPDLPAP